MIWRKAQKAQNGAAVVVYYDNFFDKTLTKWATNEEVDTEQAQAPITQWKIEWIFYWQVVLFCGIALVRILTCIVGLIKSFGIACISLLHLLWYTP
jgi:hypothetical protein